MTRFLTIFFCVLNILKHSLSYSQDYAFYIKVDSGISCSSSVDIIAPYPPWNKAVQGYNTTLGNCAIAGFSVGCEILHAIDLEANISYRSMFTYKKYQTPTTGGASYTRRFDLSATPILFTTNLLGRGIPYCHWNARSGKIYPIIGAGLGVSNLLITNYRTTGLPPT